MSFKRAGDDHCALRLQKKQRVAQLFAEDIPANEVSQTRSGRFVCLVCPHNPILDTMPMLSIHRQGKKHLTSMTIKIEKELDLSELLQKRKQELYMKEASINNKPSDIGSKSMSSHNMLESTPLLAKTRQLTESVVRVGNGITSNARIEHRVNEKLGELFKKNKPFFQSRVELRLSRDFHKDVSSSTLHVDNPPEDKTGHQKNNCEEKLSNQDSSNCCEMNSFIPRDCSSRASDRQQQQVETCIKHSQQITGQEVKNTDGSHGENINREKQKRYLELRMSGWILDSSGKWIKDENVEFDSDEDEAVLII